MDYNPREPQYWDESRLAADMKLAFDVCNGCRLCHNLCPSFPVLFKAVENHDDDVEALTPDEMTEVADLCYQCKLCFLKCPYVPPHRFDLDFPRLMLRSKAIRTRKSGLSASDKFLGDPERSGRLGTIMPSLANWSLTQSFMRRQMEQRFGIDHRRHLPKFALTRFSRWAKKHHPQISEADVALFSTCTVEYHEAGIGQAALKVLGHNGIQAAVLSDLRCCGMPALDGGDISGATERARHNIARLVDYAKAGKKILALQPTCAYVLKQEYPVLVGTEEAQLVARATMDITEYLASLMKSGKLKRDFSQSPGTITYHLSCHSKAQGLKKAASDLLGGIEGTTVNVVDRCAGIDGTWGLKARYYDESQKVSRKLTEAFQLAHDTHACSDCALAGLQIEVASDKPPRHPVEILWAAYGLDS